MLETTIAEARKLSEAQQAGNYRALLNYCSVHAPEVLPQYAEVGCPVLAWMQSLTATSAVQASESNSVEMYRQLTDALRDGLNTARDVVKLQQTEIARLQAICSNRQREAGA